MAAKDDGAATDDRAARLAKALRENLLRRKGRARAVAADAAPLGADDAPSLDRA